MVETPEYNPSQLIRNDPIRDRNSATNLDPSTQNCRAFASFPDFGRN